MPSIEELAHEGNAAAIEIQRYRSLQAESSLDEYDIDAILVLAEETILQRKPHTLLPLDLPYLAYLIERKVLTDQLRFLDDAAADIALLWEINTQTYTPEGANQAHRIAPYASTVETLLWDADDKKLPMGLIHRDRRL